MKPSRLRQRVLTLVALSTLFISQQTTAEIVEYRIDGVITAANDPGGIGPPHLDVNDFFSIYFAYDTEAVSYYYNVESTLFYNAIRDVRLTFDGTLYEWTSPPVMGEMSVRDNYHPSPWHDHTDALTFQVANNIISPVQLIASWGMSVSGPAAPTVLGSMALPTELPELAMFDTATAFFMFSNGATGQSGSYSGRLLAMSPVPLPAPLLLFASRFLGLLSTRRLQNRSRS